MFIGQKFNQLSLGQYLFYIKGHKQYKDFNTLGLYRSIIENANLSLQEKIAVREYAHQFFKASFDFLKLKDPQVFVEVATLGLTLTKGDEQLMWDELKKDQQKILKDKRIKYRNFGTYSKHLCGYSDCIYNGLMIRAKSMLAETNMHFVGDRNRYPKSRKADMQKLDRKRSQLIINNQLNDQL